MEIGNRWTGMDSIKKNFEYLICVPVKQSAFLNDNKVRGRTENVDFCLERVTGVHLKHPPAGVI